MYFSIIGGTPLKGSIRISGAKNALLPQMAASLLTEEKVTLTNVPHISDITCMQAVLSDFGGETHLSDHTLYLHHPRLTGTTSQYEHASHIRASVLVMGPLLARLGKVAIPLPGGCAIGSRPLDLHMKGFHALGAETDIRHGQIIASAPFLKGADIYLDFPSVGATENIMLAATLAKGTTVIRNAAAEPEIADTAVMLNHMGAHIFGAGTDTVIIEGVSSLSGTTHTPIPDRIEAGTFLVAGAVAGGDLTVENVTSAHLAPVTAKLLEAGTQVTESGSSLRIRSNGALSPISIKSLPYPGFPTDMQAQMTALAAFAEGTSLIHETVFENRFNHCAELIRMGANIRLEDRTAVIKGTPLSAARVTACDLRAGAALIIAGLRAKGESQIHGISHIDRGYESIENKLSTVGANIRRIN